MKKFNFSSQPQDGAHDAIIDVNDTSPIDLVGEMCVSKLKIPKTAFPIATVPAMKRTFSLEEKIKIDEIGKTPTEMYFAVFSPLAGVSPTNCSGNDDAYFKNGTSATLLVEEGASGTWTLNNENCYILRVQSYWTYDKPQWKQVGSDEYILTNADKPIYNWAGAGNRLALREYYKYFSGETLRWWAEIRDVYDNFIMDTKAICKGKMSTYRYCTPVIALSQWLTKILGLTSYYRTHLVISSDVTYNSPADECYGLYSNAQMEICRADVKYHSEAMNQTIATGTYSPAFDSFINMSATFTFRNYNPSPDLFPVKHIAIQCLDLNYRGETISVNTTALTGTVVPSSMYFLKTFLISTQDNQRSDFIYLQDLKTQNTITVNSPKVTRFQFRFLWIDNDNNIRTMELFDRATISLQLVLYQSFLSEAKIARMSDF